MRRSLCICMLLAACSAPRPTRAPAVDPARFNGTGERLVLALEVEPESRLAGGAAYLSAPDAPELAWIPFDMREPMPDAPVAPQVHLLSEPLDERQREAVFRDPQPAWRLFVDLAFSAGGLVLREGMPRAWFATLTPDENGVRIGPWLELPLGP